MSLQFESRFKVTDKLGEGGMAEVFRVHDSSLERTVAMKSMNLKTALSADGRRRFHTEAMIMGQLGHPGVVPIFDAGETPEGRAYYLMKEIQDYIYNSSTARYFFMNFSIGFLFHIVD